MRLKAGGVGSWRRGKVDPTKFADWVQYGYAVGKAASVSAVVDRFEAWRGATAGDHLDLTVVGDDVSVEGALDEASFLELRGLVGALWRSAARFEGVGELTFSSAEGDIEDRIVIDGRSSRFVPKKRLPKPSKFNASTKPEDARETVWVHVMNDSMTSARRAVGQYLDAKLPIVPVLAHDFLAAFDDAVDKAGPIVDAISSAIDKEIADGAVRVWRAVDIEEGNALAWYKNDFLNKLMWTMIEMKRETDSIALFERWRDAGGRVSLSNYGRYFCALSRLKRKEPIAPALDAFDALWATIRPNARMSGDAGAIFANAAGAAALIGDRARVLANVRLALDAKYPWAKIAADPDFAAYVGDADFVALGTG